MSKISMGDLGSVYNTGGDTQRSDPYAAAAPAQLAPAPAPVPAPVGKLPIARYQNVAPAAAAPVPTAPVPLRPAPASKAEPSFMPTPASGYGATSSMGMGMSAAGAMAGASVMASSAMASFSVEGPEGEDSLRSFGQRMKTTVSHNLRGFGEFTGFGTEKAFNFSFSEILPRLHNNIVYFSANYLVLTMVVAFCTAFMSPLFLVCSGAIAYGWNQVFKFNAISHEHTVLGFWKIGNMQRQLAMGAASTAFVITFGKGMIVSILITSSVFIVLHAITRNMKYEQPYEETPSNGDFLETPQVEL